jgi:hypothetical protein
MRVLIYILIISICISGAFLFTSSIVSKSENDLGITQKVQKVKKETPAKTIAVNSKKWLKLNYDAAGETLMYNFSSLEYMINAKIKEIEKQSELFKTIKNIVVFTVKKSKKTVKKTIEFETENNLSKDAHESKKVFT